MAMLLLQLGAFGLLLIFSPHIYLWLKGIPFPRDEAERFLLLMGLSSTDADNLQRIAALTLLGRLLVLGAGVGLLIHAFV